MYWHRLERSLGRFSLVGTTVQAAERLPRHLVADEKHTTLGGKKVYLAATAGGGCCLGMALAETAGTDDLTKAYGVFRDEARRLDPEYRPETVNTDGWPATQAAWRALFKGVTLILCFLHAFLKIRERAVHLKETFDRAAGAGLGGVPRPGRPVVLAAASSPAGVGSEAHVDKEIVREKVLVAVRQARGVRAGVRPPRLPSDEQPGGPAVAAARLPPVLRPASARLDGGRRAGAAGLGVDPQLRPVVPLDGPGVTRAAEPGRAAQREAVSPRVAPEPAGLGVTRRLSQASPKSVISSNFSTLLAEPDSLREQEGLGLAARGR